jgi:hypothetical protein
VFYTKSANTHLKYWHLSMFCMQLSDVGGIIKANVQELLYFIYIHFTVCFMCLLLVVFNTSCHNWIVPKHQSFS